MAGEAGVATPEILAGPILQRITPSSAVVWIVTSVVLDPKKVRGEVWDPLPPGLRGFISEPNPALPTVGSIDVPADVEVRKAAPKVWVYRVRLRARQDDW